MSGLTKEQLAMRLTGVGGSEVAALVGQSPYMRPIDVYASKCEGRTVEDNHHMERGRFLERGVADWWAHRNAYSLTQGTTVRHPKLARVIVTPDFLAEKADSNPADALDLSIKVPGPMTWKDWGEPGTNEVPPQYLIQVQYELIVLEALHGIRKAVIAAPIGADLAEYPIEADGELQDMLVDAVDRFWTDHVEPRKPPPIDGTDNYADFLKRKFPVSSGALLPADDEAARWADAYRRARKTREEAEAAEKTAKNHLIATIGDADGLAGKDWKISYTETTGRQTTDWQAVCMEAAIDPALVKRHTKRGGSFRTFRPSFPGDK